MRNGTFIQVVKGGGRNSKGQRWNVEPFRSEKQNAARAATGPAGEWQEKTDQQ